MSKQITPEVASEQAEEAVEIEDLELHDHESENIKGGPCYSCPPPPGGY